MDMCVLVVVVYVVVEKISLHLEREYNAREKEDSTPRFFCVVCVVCARASFAPFCSRFVRADWIGCFSIQKGIWMRARALLKRKKRA